jgi:thiosulfate/3-mercaptopyruvate sulfurtransferase
MIAPFVDQAWLAAHPEGVLVDVRWYLDGRSGRAAYERSHLPGARFVDLDRWLSAEPSDATGRHPLPDPEVFAEGMRRLGVSDRDTVVAYDDAGCVTAARLVWMLRALGHEAALLDGGLTAWDGPLEDGVPEPPARGSFSAAPWPDALLAGIDDASDPRNLVIDARNADRYRGEPNPIDPRLGHVPGAHSLPCRENLNPDGTLLPVDELRARFTSLGAGDGRPVVSYCGSGVTACHNLLTMELVGLGPGRLYPGSWSQYAATDRAVETGTPG